MQTIKKIPRHFLAEAPGLPKGHRLMGYQPDGRCPMLQTGNCTIYQHRPSTCKDYDCRVFSAAGLSAEGAPDSTVNERISAWRFRYADDTALKKHQAIKQAARFIIKNKEAFPGGRAPTQAADVAIISIKVHTVFLDMPKGRSTSETAQAIIQASKEFEASPHPRPA